MLKRDKETFLRLVTGDPQLQADAIADLNTRPVGHFEDHPIAAKLVRENLSLLLDLWKGNPVNGCQDWVLQFIADAQIVDVRIKPVVIGAMTNDQCAILPTVLYLIGRTPDHFQDIGPHLRKLARHADLEVRWRVAWVASQMPVIDEATREALDILSREADPTTQQYVLACSGKPRLQ
jgi:hypothetical protein